MCEFIGRMKVGVELRNNSDFPEMSQVKIFSSIPEITAISFHFPSLHFDFPLSILLFSSLQIFSSYQPPGRELTGSSMPRTAMSFLSESNALS